MNLKERMINIVKEHKFLKEQLISGIVSSVEALEDDEYQKLSEECFGTTVSKEELRLKMENGDLTLDKMSELAGRMNTMDEPMSNKKESDGVSGEHEEPGMKQPPVAPAAAGDKPAGAHEDPGKKSSPTAPNQAGDQVTGDHAEQMDDEDEPKSMEERMKHMEQAVGEDMMSLLKDLVDKVNALEMKISQLSSEEAGEEPMEEAGEGSMDDSLPSDEEPMPPMKEEGEGDMDEDDEESPEPKPPVTQENVRPANAGRKKSVSREEVARDISKAFFG